jgi:hypothetical protein
LVRVASAASGVTWSVSNPFFFELGEGDPAYIRTLGPLPATLRIESCAASCFFCNGAGTTCDIVGAGLNMILGGGTGLSVGSS